MAEQVREAFKRAGLKKGSCEEMAEVLSALLPEKNRSQLSALVAKVPAVNGHIKARDFLTYLFDDELVDSDADPGKDSADTIRAKRFLQSHGVSGPTQADIDYVKDTNLACLVSGLVERVVKLKPHVDAEQNTLQKFSADYFSGALAEQKRLVLIASNVENHDKLKSAIKPFGDMGAPIASAMYNYEGSLLDLKSQVNDLVASNGVFKTVALVGHGGVDKKWLLTSSHGVDLDTGVPDEGVDDCLRALTNAASVRLDMMACDLGASAKVMEYFGQIEKDTQTNISASMDITGNRGNWILETDGINLIDEYFDASKICGWEHALKRRKKRRCRKRKRRTAARRQRRRRRRIARLRRRALKAERQRNQMKIARLEERVRALENNPDGGDSDDSSSSEDSDSSSSSSSS